MDLAALKTELVDDPAQLGYATPLAVGDHASVAALLNARTIPHREWVTVDRLEAWLGLSGLRLKVEIARETSADVTLRAAINTLDRLLRVLAAIDLDTDQSTQMLDAFEQAELLAAGERAALLALADTHISRAEDLWGVGTVVTHHHIGDALWEVA